MKLVLINMCDFDFSGDFGCDFGCDFGVDLNF